MDISSRDYFDARASSYQKLDWVADKQLQTVIDLHIPAGAKDSKALDLGVGTAAAFPMLYKKGYDVVGVDISKNMLRKAREFVLSQHADIHQHITFIEHGATRLPFADEFFSLAFARNALHHFDEPFDTIEEVHRTLAPGSRFVLIESVAPTLESKGVWMESLRIKDKGRNMDFTFCFPEMYERLCTTGFLISGAQLYSQSFSVSNWLNSSMTELKEVEAIIYLFESASPEFKRQMGMRTTNGQITLDRFWGIFSLDKV